MYIYIAAFFNPPIIFMDFLALKYDLTFDKSRE